MSQCTLCFAELPDSIEAATSCRPRRAHSCDQNGNATRLDFELNLLACLAHLDEDELLVVAVVLHLAVFTELRQFEGSTADSLKKPRCGFITGINLHNSGVLMRFQIQRCPKGYEHRALRRFRYYVILDGNRKWLQVSEAFAALLGYLPEELVGKSAEQMAARGDYDPTFFDRQLQNEGTEFRMTFLSKNGKKVAVMASLRVLEDGCILGVADPLK